MPWVDDRSAKDRERRGAILQTDWREKFECFADSLAGSEVYVTVDLDCLPTQLVCRIPGTSFRCTSMKLKLYDTTKRGPTAAPLSLTGVRFMGLVWTRFSDAAGTA